jgi:iron(III) transport system permease protein
MTIILICGIVAICGDGGAAVMESVLKLGLLTRRRWLVRLPLLAGMLMISAPVLMLLAVASLPGLGAGSAADPQGVSLAHLLVTVLPRYALNSLLLSLLVLVVVLIIGVGCAWLIAAYEFPLRGVFHWALVLPLALPSFVVAYAYTDFDAGVAAWRWLIGVLAPLDQGRAFVGVLSSAGNLVAAALVLGLVLYPYVYLLARAAFEERSPSLAEAALSLGESRWQAWYAVVWPIARPAVVAGCALVLMETLADFGTVAYFAVDTFTAGIYRAWQSLGDRIGAARLALSLLVLVVLLTATERRQRRRMRFFARGRNNAARTSLLGASRWFAALACLVPLFFGLLLPLGLLAHAWIESGDGIDARIWQWAANSAMLAACATLAIVPTTLLVAYGMRLMPGPRARFATGLVCSGYAVPGLVLAIGLLAIVGWVDRLLGANVFSGTIVAVVYAYSVRFFAIGYQSVEAGLTRISPSMDQSARSLGASGWETLRLVHWPLLRASVSIASILVFVDCLKELPATLVLRPLNFDTLSVVAYQYASDERLPQAAAPALMIALVSLLPVLLLSLYKPRIARGS